MVRKRRRRRRIGTTDESTIEACVQDTMLRDCGLPAPVKSALAGAYRGRVVAGETSFTSKAVRHSEMHGKLGNLPSIQAEVVEGLSSDLQHRPYPLSKRV
mmetsp:Transcript_6043/g.14447  ORF Transcript_6043/g.14447 Transcript_6043/m.14447 type:complete len:100 (-) Transcript_6043:108-407(-)